MLTLIKATANRDAALKAVVAAKTVEALTKAKAELEATSTALAEVQATISAKTERHISHEVHEVSDDEPKPPPEEEEEEEGDDDDDDDDDDKEPEDGDDDGDDDEKAAKAEDEEEEEEERCKAQALAAAESALSAAKASKAKPVIEAARAAVKSIKALRRTKASATRAALKSTVRTVTGKKSVRAAAGALQALAGERTALKQAARTSKVDAMLDAACAAGKIPPAAKDSLRTQDPKWLRAYLSALPKSVHRKADAATQGTTLAGTRDGSVPPAGAQGTTVQAFIDAQALTPDQRKVIEMSAQAEGKSFDAFVAQMNETIKARTNQARN